MVVITPLTSNKAIKVNKNGGIYKHGSRHGIEKKVAVAKALFELQEAQNKDNNDRRRTVSDARVAEQALVSTSFARKIRLELELEGCLEDPATKPKKNKREIDFGSRSLSTEDQTFL